MCILTSLTVDAGVAGEGNLEILVTSPVGANVPTQVASLGGARFEVSFGPRQAGRHEVQVTFNDEPVPGEEHAAVTRRQPSCRPAPRAAALRQTFAPLTL